MAAQNAKLSQKKLHVTALYLPALAADISSSPTPEDLETAARMDEIRPPSLRQFDQISMEPESHARHVRAIMPYFTGQRIAFVGDSDCSSALLLGLGRTYGSLPASITVFDFDKRLLRNLREFARKNGYEGTLRTIPYNVFEPLPLETVGQYDWFHTNPPYGKYNSGASARLFIRRGMELANQQGRGCVVLPFDAERPWTGTAMFETQTFLLQQNWMVTDAVRMVHSYRLDDDPSLKSGVTLIKRHRASTNALQYADSRAVQQDEISQFYGRKIMPPYPRYIDENGRLEYS